MDRFFPERLLGEIFWDGSATYEPAPAAAATRSAFVQYRDLPRSINSLNGSNSESMSKRMLAFLRKISMPVETNKVQEDERERGFRHMINERMRRQRQRQCCLALHSMLPLGTKTDNNSVIQMAAKEILRLQVRRQELQKQKFESNQVQYLRVPHPESGIDSLLETLKCLKHQGLDTRTVKSTFSPHQLFAAFELLTDHKVADGDGERSSWTTLDNDEVDRNLHSNAREGSNKKQKTILLDHEALDQL